MPAVSFLDAIPLSAFFVVTTLGLILAIEGGFQLGTWRRKQTASEKDSSVGAVVAATLGLVGFILAMTFGFAVSRFEGRQEAYLGELNAIGTIYLRADFLPEPQRARSKQALRDYVDVRTTAVEHQSIAQGIALSEEIHSKLWSTLGSLDPSNLNSMSVALYTQSLNETIDLHEERVMAGVRLRIPQTLWLVLIIISLLGMGEIGYQTGLASSTRTPVSLGLVIAFALLLYLIADLDRPLEGSLRINQSAMRALQERLNIHERLRVTAPPGSEPL
jgi:hypothetical protein